MAIFKDRKPVIKIIILFFIVTATVSIVTAKQSPHQKDELQRLVNTVEGDSLLRFGEWGITVMEAASGKTLVEVNGNKSLAPASNLKLVTTAVALKIFGSDFEFQTKIGNSGDISDGNLNGDLLVYGGGDPALGSAQIRNNMDMEQVISAWSKAIKDNGIKRISGDIIADVSYFDPISTPDGWQWVDIGNYYGAGVSALNFNDNLYHLFFKPGNIVGDPAIVMYTRPEVKGLTFLNYMKTGPVGSGDNGYIYGGPGEERKTLLGTIPAGKPEFSIKGSLPNPALFCVQALRENLIKDGILVSGTAKISHSKKAATQQITTTSSPSIKEIVYWINKKSINLYAEVLLKQVGEHQSGKASYDCSTKAVEVVLKEMGIPVEGLHLYDGSGLARLNALTTNQMAQLLVVMANDIEFKSFYDSLPIAGIKDDSGHISHLCRNTSGANNVRAKTGYISRVRAHSGYVHTKSGKLLCFSMIANDHLGRPSQIDRLHEKIMIELAELED